VQILGTALRDLRGVARLMVRRPPAAPKLLAPPRRVLNP